MKNIFIYKKKRNFMMKKKFAKMKDSEFFFENYAIFKISFKLKNIFIYIIRNEKKFYEEKKIRKGNLKNSKVFFVRKLCNIQNFVQIEKYFYI